MIVGILLTTAVSVLSVVNPYISGQIVDQVISGGKYDRLMPFIGCLIGVTIVMGVLRFLFQVAFETASQGVLYDMRDKVYRKLLEEDFAFYNKKRTGDLMSRQTGDMDAIRHFVAYVVYMVYQSVLMFVFALLMIFTVNTKLALAMLVVLPFTAFATYRQTKEVRPAFKRNRDCFSSLNAFVQENVSGNRVVKAFAKEDFEIEKFNKENDKFRAAQIDASKIWMKYVPIFEVLSYALTIILILYGGYMVIQGEITLGQLVTVNGYLWMLNNPLRQAGWLVNDISNFTTSVEKIYATYSEEPHVKTPVSGVVKKHLKGEIEFKNVSYRADDEDIVMDVNFKVKPGQTVGIIGSTGAGNDQVRFDLTFQILAPEIGIITPTRDMTLTREYEIEYLKKHGYTADFKKMEYSINKGLWGTSIGGKETLKSDQTLPESAYPSQMTATQSKTITLDFVKGEIAGINGKAYDNKVAAIQDLEALAAPYAIGRDMHIGDTIIGIKGRVGFEAAAPMLIIAAHKMLEKHTLTKWQQYWKDQVGTWYGMFLHEAQYLEPVMRDIEAFLDSSQQNVTGRVIIELHPYRYVLVGVESDYDLMKSDFGEYGEVNKAWSADDVKGFTKILGNQMKIFYSVQNKNKK